MFVDTHAHIYLSDFDNDRKEAIQRSGNSGITAIYMPNIDSDSVDALLNTESEFAECFAMIGLHPCSVKADYQTELKIVEKLLAERKFAGIGEVGIDLFWDRSFEKEQRDAFRRQITMAKDASMPVIIHSREALDITIDIVTEMQDGSLAGIFHCFNGTVSQAHKIEDCGFLMGIGGVITYKNAGLDKVMEVVGIQNTVLETDAPYLSPVPFRGKRNECAYIEYIARKLADVSGADIHTVADITTRNANNLFARYTKP